MRGKPGRLCNRRLTCGMRRSRITAAHNLRSVFGMKRRSQRITVLTYHVRTFDASNLKVRALKNAENEKNDRSATPDNASGRAGNLSVYFSKPSFLNITTDFTAAVRPTTRVVCCAPHGASRAEPSSFCARNRRSTSVGRRIFRERRCFRPVAADRRAVVGNTGAASLFRRVFFWI